MAKRNLRVSETWLEEVEKLANDQAANLPALQLRAEAPKVGWPRWLKQDVSRWRKAARDNSNQGWPSPDRCYRLTAALVLHRRVSLQELDLPLETEEILRGHLDDDDWNAPFASDQRQTIRDRFQPDPHSPASLDRWVNQHIDAVRRGFGEIREVADRDVYVPVRSEFGHLRDPAEPSPQLLRAELAGKPFCLVLSGEGGAGKTTLAFQVARWTMAYDPDQRIDEQLMLPVLVDRDIRPDPQSNALLVEIGHQLQRLANMSEPPLEDHLRALLRDRRVLVIVDHYSEMTPESRDLLSTAARDLPINALIVTTRRESDFNDRRPIRIRPGGIDKQHVIRFVTKYLEEIGKPYVLDDDELKPAREQLSRLVERRSITPLLAQQFIEVWIDASEKERASFPLNIPDLMGRYLLFLNRSRSGEDFRDDQVRSAVERLGWECVRENFFPNWTSRSVLLDALRECGDIDREAMLEFLLTRLHVLTPSRSDPGQLRFNADPMAEYMAGFHLCKTLRDNEAWQNLLQGEFEARCEDKAAARGLLMAAAECCEHATPRPAEWKVIAGQLRVAAGENIASGSTDQLPAKIESHRRLLADSGDNHELVAGLLKSLAQYGTISLQLIIPYLNHKAAEVRSAAAGALCEMLRDQPGEEIVQLSSEFACHAEPAVAEATVAEIARTGMSVLPSIEAFLTHPAGQVQLAAYTTLTSVLRSSPESLPTTTWESYQHHPNPRVATMAVTSMPSKANAATLQRLLNDNCGDLVRMAYICSLESLGDRWPAAGTAGGLDVGIAKIAFRWCPAGQFMMGSPPDEKGRYDDEAQVDVKHSRGFWLGATAVTCEQWQSVMGAGTGSASESARKGNHPITGVDWHGATEFCRRLTRIAADAGQLAPNWQIRLPTVAEWEYGCRAGSETAYCFGNDPAGLGEYAWYGDNAGGGVHPVGKKQPNKWGLYDMHGNVWEWCKDTYQETLVGGKDPIVVSGRFSRRVPRGGSWGDDARSCRAAYRLWIGPAFRLVDLGFRVAAVPLGGAGKKSKNHQ